MRCRNADQVLSREYCYNRWPDFPCYSSRERACYDEAGTTQLFDPVSDMMYGASNAYLMLFDFASRLLTGRDVVSSPQTDQTIRETLHDYGMPLYGGPATVAIPEGVRNYIPAVVRPRGPTTTVPLQTNIPLIHLAENVGPGLRYTTIRDRADNIRRLIGVPAPRMQRQISPDDEGEGKKKRYKKKRTRHKKRKKGRKRWTRR